MSSTLPMLVVWTGLILVALLGVALVCASIFLPSHQTDTARALTRIEAEQEARR